MRCQIFRQVAQINRSNADALFFEIFWASWRKICKQDVQTAFKRDLFSVSLIICYQFRLISLYHNLIINIIIFNTNFSLHIIYSLNIISFFEFSALLKEIFSGKYPKLFQLSSENTSFTKTYGIVTLALSLILINSIVSQLISENKL